ncbi:DivIVA domain-containing protein [uncultured Actinomyces sp.]|uniref:DivIVA domain-containing protein n=1 Tax=uncultured Actinomyces sp. TaxID=249061 RepID=UPI0037DC270D
MLLTADHVEQMRLPTTTNREGYEKSSVDAYVEEIVATLRAWETEADDAAPDYVLHSGDVTGAAFPAIHDEGYEEERVDEFLDNVVSTLVHYETRAAAGARAGAPGAGAGDGVGAAMTADETARRTFRVVKLRGGYDRQAVDAFMTRIVATLRAHEAATWRRGGPEGLLTSADVINIKFQATALRSGYEQDEVDEFLDDVAQALAAYEVRD